MAQITRTPGADIPRNQPHCRREAGPRELWRMRLPRVTDESPRSTEFPLERRCRGGGTRTPDLRFWRAPLFGSLARLRHLRAGPRTSRQGNDLPRAGRDEVRVERHRVLGKLRGELVGVAGTHRAIAVPHVPIRPSLRDSGRVEIARVAVPTLVEPDARERRETGAGARVALALAVLGQGVAARAGLRP